MLQNLEMVHFFIFIVFFVFIFYLEYFFPLRKKIENTQKRWFQNWSLSLINALCVRVLSFVTPVGAALYIEKHDWGLFHLVDIPIALELLISIVILDFCIYLQHVASHKWSWFWRLHQIHHSDVDLDVSTALRFHVGEISISLVYKVLLVAIFGFSAIIFATFEIILVCSAIFNHANLRLPHKLEKYMSYTFVTPQFHQVHHSVIHKQTNSNYGFFFSCWDRFCNTYTPHHFFVEKFGLNNTKKSPNLWELLILKIKKK